MGEEIAKRLYDQSAWNVVRRKEQKAREVFAARGVRCLKCRNRWVPAAAAVAPKQCPNCRTALWDIPWSPTNSNWDASMVPLRQLSAELNMTRREIERYALTHGFQADRIRHKENRQKLCLALPSGEAATIREALAADDAAGRTRQAKPYFVWAGPPLIKRRPKPKPKRARRALVAPQLFIGDDSDLFL